MAKIISLSLDEENLRELDKAQADMGFSGRSETARAAIQMLIQERRERARLKGMVDAVLILVHKEKHDEAISQIRHAHQSIIKTQLHNHLENHNCLETFVLNGPAREVNQLLEDFQTSGKVDQAKLIVA